MHQSATATPASVAAARPGTWGAEGAATAEAQSKIGEGVLWLQVPFRGTVLSVRIEARGQSLSKEHIARVRKYLELAEDDLEIAGVGFVPPGD